MFSGLFRALLLSPYHGLLVAIAAIPVMIATMAAVRVLGSVGMMLPPMVVAVVVTFLAGIFSQSARYAASVSGLQSVTQQPTQKEALLRSTSATFLVAALGFGLLVGLLAFREGNTNFAELKWEEVEAMFAKLSKMLQAPVSAEQTLAFAQSGPAPIFFTMFGFVGFLITLAALMVVPRATGLQEGYERAHTPGMNMLRLVIGLPYCMVATSVVLSMLFGLSDAIMGMAGMDLAMSVRTLLFVSLVVFTGMIFTFEAHVLQIGHRLGEGTNVRSERDRRDESQDLRALRQAWSYRT